jgi:hypothetical protein
LATFFGLGLGAAFFFAAFGLAVPAVAFPPLAPPAAFFARVVLLSDVPSVSLAFAEAGNGAVALTDSARVGKRADAPTREKRTAVTLLLPAWATLYALRRALRPTRRESMAGGVR